MPEVEGIARLGWPGTSWKITKKVVQGDQDKTNDELERPDNPKGQALQYLERKAQYFPGGWG